MGQRLADQAAVLVHHLGGRDRLQVAGEGEQPAGEGVGAADAEAAPVGVAVDRLAEPGGGGRGAGVAPERDDGLDRVAGAQLPGLAGAGVVAEIESRPGSRSRGVPGFVAFTSALGDPAEPVVLDRASSPGVAGGEIPVLVEEEEPERLDGAPARRRRCPWSDSRR